MQICWTRTKIGEVCLVIYSNLITSSCLFLWRRESWTWSPQGKNRNLCAYVFGNFWPFLNGNCSLISSIENCWTIFLLFWACLPSSWVRFDVSSDCRRDFLRHPKLCEKEAVAKFDFFVFTYRVCKFKRLNVHNIRHFSRYEKLF